MSKLKLWILFLEIFGLFITIVGIVESIKYSHYLARTGAAIPNMESVCYGLIASSLIISITWIITSDKKKEANG